MVELTQLGAHDVPMMIYLKIYSYGKLAAMVLAVSPLPIYLSDLPPTNLPLPSHALQPVTQCNATHGG